MQPINEPFDRATIAALALLVAYRIGNGIQLAGLDLNALSSQGDDIA